AVENENWEEAISIIKTKYENKPELYLNLEKIRKSQNIDRKLTWKEFLELAFGIIPALKNKEEKLNEECDKFISIHKPNSKEIPYIINYFKTYVGDKKFRKIIEEKRYGDLNFCSSFGINDFKALNKEERDTIPEYVKNYINLDTYAV
ncbi:MAG: restriction endonuclease subunit R, partial [Deltaproteobacteria bacterium]|nr:restriction endonuclease subunit R [Deltaproteobacteria bacterium]